jgi:hypothetical protein
VEQGTHAALMAKQGVYANLYALQLGSTASVPSGSVASGQVARESIAG